MHAQPITLYSTLQRTQFYYWNLFSTPRPAWCCCFGVRAPQLAVSTSNSYQPMGAAPVCLLSYPLGILGAWKNDREEKLHDCFKIFFKHIICCAVSQYLAVVRQQGD
jgi:hypothetical protein